MPSNQRADCPRKSADANSENIGFAWDTGPGIVSFRSSEATSFQVFRPPFMPPNPDSPSRAPARSSLRPEPADGRVVSLRAEIAASTDNTRKAALHFELGHLLEQRDGNPAAAVREYLTAYNLDANFRPPLFALVRIFERRRSFKNLERLYAAEEQSSSSGADAASAILDRAVLLADHLDEPEGGRRAFAQALETFSNYPAAALMLEREVRARGEEAEIPRLLELRAECTQDARMKSLLYVELAFAREARGELDEAFAALDQVVNLGVETERALRNIERLARRHRRPERAAAALEAQADRLVDAAPGSEAADQRAALLYDAARICVLELGDPERAIACLERAITVRPDDPLLLEEHLLACELAGDLERAARDALALLRQGGITGPAAARLHFRLAELAQARGDSPEARAALENALRSAPDSPTLQGLFEDLLVDAGADDERLEFLAKRAEEASGARRADLAWRAAQVASDDRRDFERAHALYTMAIGAADDPTPILRELYFAARRHARPEIALAAATTLLDRPLDPEERSALLYESHTLARIVDSSGARAAAILERALEDDLARAWALDAARLHAARNGDDAALARTHQELASLQSEPAERAAHLCAAARARLRAGDSDGAVENLRSALDEVPGHRYAVALLEEVLKARGDGEAVVALLRDAAASSDGSEASLLRAGAAAEAAGDPALAAKTYEEAADRDPMSVAPLLALRRLAERTKDRELLLRALEALSEREVAAGDPGRLSLELGELYALTKNAPDLAEGPLRAALEGSATEVAAALAMATLLPSPTLAVRDRMRAFERLAAVDEPRAREGLLRDIAIGALLDGDPEVTSRAIEALKEVTGDSPHQAVAALRLVAAWGTGDDRDRADLFIDLAEATSDPRAGAELLLQGLRTKTIALGDGAEDDAFILAHELAAKHPDSMAAAVALSETTSAADDPEARADALRARLERSGREGRSVLTMALARSLSTAGRAIEALPLLESELSTDPDDLAGWEALRVAARQAERWEDVVRACDRLAESVPTELRALLLEEAGAVLMDKLGRDDEAETRLKTAFDLDPTRAVAYGRLHDLLTERDDVDGLLALVTQRLDATDDRAERIKLFYERARLERAEHDREGALEALDQVLSLDPAHAGALALAVEIHVSLEQFDAAIDMLKRLAAADVPASQKRLAHLGAADFLAKKRGDPEAALAELAAIVELGLADAPLYVRMANLAEAMQRYEVAASHVFRAAELSEGAKRAELALRAGAIHEEKRGEPSAAIHAYRFALDAVPTDLDALERLLPLLASEAAKEVCTRFESALRASVLDREPMNRDALSKLARMAELRGDSSLLAHLEDALDVLDGASSSPRVSPPAWRSRALLTPEALALCGVTELDPPSFELAKIAGECLMEYTGWTATGLGLGKAELLAARDVSPARDELVAIAGAFGLELGDIYTSTSPSRPIVFFPGKKERVSAALRADLSRARLDRDARCAAGRLAFGHAFASTALLTRGIEDAADLLFAVTVAAGVPLPASQARSHVATHATGIAKVLSRRARRSIGELVPKFRDGGAEVIAFCRTLHRAAHRAGLLVGADLGASIRALSDPALAATGRDLTNDLHRFWASRTTLEFLRAGTKT